MKCSREGSSILKRQPSWCNGACGPGRMGQVFPFAHGPYCRLPAAGPPTGAPDDRRPAVAGSAFGRVAAHFIIATPAEASGFCQRTLPLQGVVGKRGAWPSLLILIRGAASAPRRCSSLNRPAGHPVERRCLFGQHSTGSTQRPIRGPDLGAHHPAAYRYATSPAPSLPRSPGSRPAFPCRRWADCKRARRGCGQNRAKIFNAIESVG